ncbi:hypothetical protein ACLOJK_023518 [Asimina triloba]
MNIRGEEEVVVVVLRDGRVSGQRWCQRAAHHQCLAGARSGNGDREAATTERQQATTATELRFKHKKGERERCWEIDRKRSREVENQDNGDKLG